MTLLRNPEETAAVDEPAAAHARLVLFRADDEHYRARATRRERVLAMTPIDPTEAGTAARARRGFPPGVHWEYLQPDDVPLLVRARDLQDEEDALWDAEMVFADARRLRVVYVQDRSTRHLSWWLALDQDVVLVAPTAWASSKRTGAAAHARRAMRALRHQPPWGEYTF